jgi:hypothetical protein
MQWHWKVSKIVSKLYYQKDHKMDRHLDVKESLNGDAIIAESNWLCVTSHCMVAMKTPLSPQPEKETHLATV